MTKLNNTNNQNIKELFEDFSIEPSGKVWENIESFAPSPEKIQVKGGRNSLWYTGAAVIIASILFFLFYSNSNDIQEPKNQANNIAIENSNDINLIADQENLVENNNDESNSILETSNVDNNLQFTETGIEENNAKTENLPDNLVIDNNTGSNIETNNINPNHNIENTILHTENTGAKINPEEEVQNNGNKISLWICNDTSICYGERAILRVKGAKSYHWSNGFSASNIEVYPKVTTVFKVEATMADNSVIERSVTVKVDHCIFVPNAFSPNNDRNNDVFKAEGDNLTDFHIQVFTRGSQLVFESDDIEIGWDGTFRGNPLPASTYIYIINYKDADGFVHVKKGTVILVK